MSLGDVRFSVPVSALRPLCPRPPELGGLGPGSPPMFLESLEVRAYLFLSSRRPPTLLQLLGVNPIRPSAPTERCMSSRIGK